ncbi:MAG: hypothetical protein IKO09_00465 [Bacteroidales bacterium]|nr:hypothetical protein [Bacteroidales bacterium]
MKALKVKWKGINPFIKLPEVGDKYSFVSYGIEGERLGSGTVEVTVVGTTTITLEVLTNEPVEDFVGQSYDVKIEDMGKTKLPLYTTEGEATGISVEVSEYVEPEVTEPEQQGDEGDDNGGTDNNDTEVGDNTGDDAGDNTEQQTEEPQGNGEEDQQNG